MPNDTLGIYHELNIYASENHVLSVLSNSHYESRKSRIFGTLPSYNSTTEKIEFLGLFPKEYMGIICYLKKNLKEFLQEQKLNSK